MEDNAGGTPQPSHFRPIQSLPRTLVFVDVAGHKIMPSLA
jgi:hypothetical protein